MDRPDIAYWCLLVAALLPYTVLAIAKAGRSYDNADPRNPACYDTPLKRRAQAAHLNSLEAFPFFAVGVLLAIHLGVAAHRLDMLCLAWVAFRIAYIGCYVGNVPTARSIMWLGGWGISIALFVIALT